jgi:hypothetical protein
MCLEADRRVGMLDRAGHSNDFFRFSTTKMEWEQLDASKVKGSPPGPRDGHGMVAVGFDLYVFGGNIPAQSNMGEEGQRGGRIS